MTLLFYKVWIQSDLMKQIMLVSIFFDSWHSCAARYWSHWCFCSSKPTMMIPMSFASTPGMLTTTPHVPLHKEPKLHWIQSQQSSQATETDCSTTPPWYTLSMQMGTQDGLTVGTHSHKPLDQELRTHLCALIIALSRKDFVDFRELDFDYNSKGRNGLH